MARLMADRKYREDQWVNRYRLHVEPLNRFIDDLGRLDDAGPPPYIAPSYKGVNCPALALLRDPGPKAGGLKGSGFLSVENDDPTAERQYWFMVEAGIEPADVLPWNAYPWYINAKPNTRQLRAGSGPLKQLLDLLPRLRIVLLLGGDAKRAWALFESLHPLYLEERRIAVRATHHASRQALFHRDPDVRAGREQDIRDAFGDAAAIVRG